mgnify:CR=1 FL=1
MPLVYHFCAVQGFLRLHSVFFLCALYLKAGLHFHGPVGYS